MATKYGYVQRDPQDTQLNWNQIATDTVDMLNNEVKVREEKKAAIDKATQDYQTILNNVPQGENTQLNEFALNAADKLQKQMLMQETLLKSGQLNPKQYTIMRQNLSDGTDQAFSLIQDYNDEYATKMSMMSSDLPVNERLSRMDAWMMEQVEGFANFTETELVVNPQSGVMSMAKLIDDPNNPGQLIPDPDPNNLVTVQQLQNRIKSKKTQYDVIGGADNYIKGLGEQKVVMERLGNKYKAGIFKTIEDIRAREGGFEGKSDAELQVLATEMGVDLQDLKGYNLFQQSQNTFIEGELNSNPDFGCSVLVDFVNQTPDGKEYDMTFNPDDVFINGDPANGRIPGTENMILMESKGGRQIPNLSDEQKAVAREAYKAQIDIGLDYKESVNVQQVYKEKRPKTAIEVQQGKTEKKQANVMTNIAKLYYGDKAQIQEAESAIRASNPNIIGLDRSGEDVIIEYKDGRRETIPFSVDGQTQTQEQWVKGNANFFLNEEDKIDDINSVLKKVSVDFSKPLNTTDSVVNVGEEESTVYQTKDGETKSFNEMVQYDIQQRVNKIDTDLIIPLDKETEAVKNVNEFLLGTGYTAEESGATDNVLIRNANGTEVAEISVDGGDTGAAKEIRDFVKNVKKDMLNNKSAEDKALMITKYKKDIKTKKNLRGNQGGGNNQGGGGLNGGNYNNP